MPVSKMIYYTQDGICHGFYARYQVCMDDVDELERQRREVDSLHERFKYYRPDFKMLEISSISREPLGVAVSAANLRDPRGNLTEAVYLGSRVYEQGQLEHLYHASSTVEAMRITKASEHNMFSSYNWYGKAVPTNPLTLMKYWIWCDAVYNQKDLMNQIVEYDAFTNYFCNTSKDYFGTYPEAAALFVTLYRNGILDTAMDSVESLARLAYGVNLN